MRVIRGTLEHPKFLDLKIRLGLPAYRVAGILECLWHFTARFAPHGDIGRWPNVSIARALEWDGDADALIDALVSAGWLDETEFCRLFVHDYPRHADDAIQRQLARAIELFADGTRPKTTRLSAKERARIEREYQLRAHDVRTLGARRAHVGRPTPPHPTSEKHRSTAAPLPPQPPALPAPPPAAKPQGVPASKQRSTPASQSRRLVGGSAAASEPAQLPEPAAAHDGSSNGASALPAAVASATGKALTPRAPKRARSTTHDRRDIDDQASRFCVRFAEALIGREPRFKRPTPTSMQRWHDQARLMLRERGAEAWELADWLFNSESDEAAFWRSNVLSVPKMRKQFDQLREHRKRADAKRASRADSWGEVARRVRDRLETDDDSGGATLERKI